MSCFGLHIEDPQYIQHFLIIIFLINPKLNIDQNKHAP